MSAKVRDLIKCLDEIAPFSLCEEWDNVGLIVGDPDAEAECVLCALDLNEAVINEAIACKADVIVAHHPILFRGTKRICEDKVEGRLIRKLIKNDISFIAMHTNFDNASPGVNDALAQKLGLINVTAIGNGMRIGEVAGTSFDAFAGHVRDVLGGPVRCYEPENGIIKKVAVLGGAGEDYIPEAIENGADVFITGEVSYHKALDAVALGMGIIEAGHRETERPGVNLLCRGLQNALDAVQYNIRVFESKI